MSTPRIMIVDDDTTIRSLLVSTLPTDGYELLEARGGSEAIELMLTKPPDLVLLDWKMPGPSGAEVLAELKKRHPNVPVIVLTAENRSFPRTLAEALGAEVFMTKPFSPLGLLAEVERLLPQGLVDQTS
jgi:DNA-binding response OmpR family regulator